MAHTYDELHNLTVAGLREIAEALASFEPGSLADMRTDDGLIVATCEFCHTDYEFDDGQIGQLRGT